MSDVGGTRVFAEWCQDEFWDLEVTQFGPEVFIAMRREDPRREKLLNFLFDVSQDVGFRFVATDSVVWVRFDQCGAQTPSMIFKLRSTFQKTDHVDAAKRRDRKDDLEMLGIFASTHKPFPKGMVHRAIRRIQWALGEAGYGTNLDGRWDRRTRFQLWRFRRRHHLSTPPYITEATLDALEV